ncbi:MULTISPECIES: KAP family P-loop NTPase fold protein [Psychrilyobacter]|uniref:KAP NTPase domain-containing protein n=1 Tax=Psychrilyobacter piezotolerans TaxID=2293438 RepID=A0ABX9KDC2_9FUSO|nr:MULTISPECIES: P-loop NTPase fold protein [Psychrilyobacter]MCS5422668.1 KAP family NTPase [Psychrilyobacter sp. S5]NDI79196.1 hypothetical protein [Psychrilyobacter piezotolerans]RDE58877.1 hypothetical protein DV867_14950 [Psychrilyobacter sp. S5]REI39387.1 hypothetical protein DYH56_14950 [Psychrilyobacter piezotolerans]
MSFLEKTDDVKISDKNPFLNCKLKRKPIADNLTKIIEGTNCKKGFVFGIDSPWGTGKTTFIKMWEKQLRLEKSEDIFTIYFNAWENDFHGDVLLALIGELDKHLDEIKNVNKKDLVKVTKSIIGDLAVNLVKSKTLGILDLKKLYNELEATEKRELFNQYQKYKEIKENIQKDLVKIKEKLNVKKVIFFIDELDRCRPDYAIETLEKIKHLFEVEGYIFVLSLDKEQLSHSVSTIYGNGMDSEGYLRRFIDLDYSLPNLSKDNYINYLMEKHHLDENIENTKYFWEVISNFSKMEEISLRDLEKLFYKIKLILPLTSFYDSINDSSDAIEIVLGSMYAYFICLNQKYNDVYNILMSSRPNIFGTILNGGLVSQGISDEEKKIMVDNYNKNLNWVEIKDENFQEKIEEILIKINERLSKKTTSSIRSYENDSIISKIFEENRFIIKDHIEFIGNFKLQ